MISCGPVRFHGPVWLGFTSDSDGSAWRRDRASGKMRDSLEGWNSWGKCWRKA